MIYKLNERGRYHAENNIGNQDCVMSENNDRFSVIVLSDGVSSCRMAGEGAKIACDTALKLLYGFPERFLEMEPRESAKIILSHILYRLNVRAGIDKEDVREYSGTLSCVLHDGRENKLFCMNLGDGMIMASDGGRCRLLAMPEDGGNGICTTTTKGASGAALCRILDVGGISSVTVFSDGAWRRLYSGNRLKEEAAKLISGSDHRGLEEFIRSQDCPDDFSFLAIDLRDGVEGRKTA